MLCNTDCHTHTHALTRITLWKHYVCQWHLGAHRHPKIDVDTYQPPHLLHEGTFMQGAVRPADTWGRLNLTEPTPRRGLHSGTLTSLSFPQEATPATPSPCPKSRCQVSVGIATTGCHDWRTEAVHGILSGVPQKIWSSCWTFYFYFVF